MKLKYVLPVFLGLMLLSGIIIFTFSIWARSPGNIEKAEPVQLADVRHFANDFADIHINHVSGFSLAFSIRNTWDKALYYGDGYRIYKYEDEEWVAVALPEESVANSTEINRRIDANTIRRHSHSFGHGGGNFDFFELPFGRYKFVRNYFVNPNDTNDYKTLVFEFGIWPWWADSFGLGTEEDAQDNWMQCEIELQKSQSVVRFHNRRQKHISFVTAGDTSEIITLASKVEVSRTEIAFGLHNFSDEEFMYGLGFELAKYVDGRWQPAPFAHDYWAVSDIGLIIEGGDTLDELIQFTWIFGELEPGKYMFIRSHSPSSRPRDNIIVDIDQEYLMVKFVVEENTPLDFER